MTVPPSGTMGAARASNGAGHPVDTPLISVVITCFNQAHFLAEAIESTRSQSYPEIEIVVVDDGSIDDTAQVCAEYPELRYIKQSNQGLSAARNTGLRNCGGEFLVFLDADDRLLAHALETGCRFLRRNPHCAFVSGGYRRIALDGTLLRELVPPQIIQDHYIELLQGNYIGMHAAVMYRRDVLLAHGQFDKSVRACEDYDAYLRIARLRPVLCHDNVVAEYRIHQASMSADHAMMLTAALAVLARQRPYVSGKRPLRKAYRRGQRWWVWYYGRKIILAAGIAGIRGSIVRSVRALSGLVGSVTGVCREHVRMMTWRRRSPSRLRRLAPRWAGGTAAVGRVVWGSLRSLNPLRSPRDGGYASGVDRHYLDEFLGSCVDDIRGRVLDVGPYQHLDTLAVESITERLVMPLSEPPATEAVDAQLAGNDQIASGDFDCVLVAQVLHRLYDYRAALKSLYTAMKPGGLMLATIPGVSAHLPARQPQSGHWRFTSVSAQRVFEELFPPGNVFVTTYGNVLTATASLHGIPVEDLAGLDLSHVDHKYQVLIAVRAVKPMAPHQLASGPVDQC